MEMALFYTSIYLIALGNGAHQSNIPTFGADQFDEEHSKEGHSKVAFFSYFYLALNLGSLFSNTILGYFEDEGIWALGFWTSAGSAFVALVLFFVGTPRFRHFKPGGNPLSRFCQVLVAASRKWRVQMPPVGEKDLFDKETKESSTNANRRILHTHGFKFLDKAAYISSRDLGDQQNGLYNPWRLCPITQVEEVKCILRLLPIWLCTIIYSVVFTQMASLFVEQVPPWKQLFPTSEYCQQACLALTSSALLYSVIKMEVIPKDLVRVWISVEHPQMHVGEKETEFGQRDLCLVLYLMQKFENGKLM